MMLAGVILAAIPAFATLSLTDAQERAVANSVDVQTAVATARQREAELTIARRTGIPHVAADYTLGPQANAANNGTIEQSLVSVGLGVSINDLVAQNADVRVAAAELLAAQRNADAAVVAARENATRLYFTALQTIAVERVRADAIAGAQRDRTAAQLRARSGESPQLDVVRADVTLAQAYADFARARADRTDAVESLAVATAVDPASLSTLNASPAVVANLPAQDRAVARALALRPEVTALLATIESRMASIAVARRLAFPTATVQAGYQTGVDTGIPVHGPSVTAHVEIPLAATVSPHVAAAQAQLAIAQAQLLAERRTLTLEIASALRDARAQEVAATAAERGRAEAQRALAAVEIGYREGASSSLDVAEARRTYEQAAVDALVAEYKRAQAIARIQVIVP
ncbi:MAG: TolC family protein [Candidatus Eremiobacteraeota bacterium]|nr:TolC family protein [Candidatus Eremiobacteraeota bacterium]